MPIRRDRPERRALPQDDLVVLHDDRDRRALEVLALEQRQGQGVLDLALQHPAQRARTVVGVVARSGQPCSPWGVTTRKRRASRP